MAITSIKTGSSFTNLQKYNDFLGPNPAYDPAATWLIERVTVGTDAASITFSSIPSTYTSLQIRMTSRMNAYNANANITSRLTFNGDTSSTYWFHWLEGNGSAASAGGSNNTYINIRSSVMDTADSNTSAFAVGIIDIHDYASTSKNKTVRYLAGNEKNVSNTAYRITTGSGLWPSTAAITSLTLTNEIDKYETGSTFALYGMVG
jgi:hypothetical protein